MRGFFFSACQLFEGHCLKGLMVLFVLVFSLASLGAQESVPQLPAGRLFFSGLTPGGWQIFEANLPSLAVRQLTSSVGDKRDPQFLDGKKVLVCRRADGALMVVDGSGRESEFARGAEAWAGYHFMPGEEKILVTKLVSNRLRRQHIYEFDLATGIDKPFAVPDRGSYGQFRLSPDGKQLALTQLFTYGEERLGLSEVTLALDSSTDASVSAPRFVSPEYSVVESPKWSRDGSLLYFAMQVNESAPMTLYQLKIETNDILALLPPGGSSKKTAPCRTSDGAGLFFQVESGGKCRIAYLNLESKTVNDLDLKRQAREPFFISDDR